MTTKEISYANVTYGVFSTQHGIEFDYEVKEDQDGNLYKSDECSDHANFREAIAEHNQSQSDYFNYGETI